jgi:hypothetical protein
MSSLLTAALTTSFKLLILALTPEDSNMSGAIALSAAVPVKTSEAVANATEPPAVLDVPLEPLLPEVPELPASPVPDVPDVPEDPSVPLLPDVPLVP